MSEDQTATSPAAELVAVVEDLVERQRQILGALVAGRPPSRDSVQAVLLGMRGVETKLRNEAVGVDTPTPSADLQTPSKITQNLDLDGVGRVAEALREVQLRLGPNIREQVAQGRDTILLTGGERDTIARVAVAALGSPTPTPATVQFVVDFEPGLWGPFLNREAADEWAVKHVDVDGSWAVTTVLQPHVETSEPSSPDSEGDERPEVAP